MINMRPQTGSQALPPLVERQGALLPPAPDRTRVTVADRAQPPSTLASASHQCDNVEAAQARCPACALQDIKNRAYQTDHCDRAEGKLNTAPKDSRSPRRTHSERADYRWRPPASSTSRTKGRLPQSFTLRASYWQSYASKSRSARKRRLTRGRQHEGREER